MIRNCESRGSRLRSSHQDYRSDKTEPDAVGKHLINPFMNHNTIVCFTMALNDPQPRKEK